MEQNKWVRLLPELRNFAEMNDSLMLLRIVGQLRIVFPLIKYLKKIKL